MWNHVFMAHAVLRARRLDRRLFWLGLVTTVLSLHRHAHRERTCRACEPFMAKLTLAYWTLAGLRRAPWRAVLAPKALVLFLWMVEDYDYELLHPWLHVLVAVDAHWYLDTLE